MRSSAQAIQSILPHLVSPSEKLSVDYAVLGTISSVIIAKEVLTQEEKIRKLEERIKYLEDKYLK